MRKTMLVLSALLISALVSGCALVSSHTTEVEGGRKTTVGLFALDNIDNGYPVLPFYSHFSASE